MNPSIILRCSSLGQQCTRLTDGSLQVHCWDMKHCQFIKSVLGLPTIATHISLPWLLLWTLIFVIVALFSNLFFELLSQSQYRVRHLPLCQSHLLPPSDFLCSTHPEGHMRSLLRQLEEKNLEAQHSALRISASQLLSLCLRTCLCWRVQLCYFEYFDLEKDLRKVSGD